MFCDTWRSIGTFDLARENLLCFGRKHYGALLVAKQKLKKYYEKTYRDHGSLYGTRALLAPQCKFSAFDDIVSIRFAKMILQKDTADT